MVDSFGFGSTSEAQSGAGREPAEPRARASPRWDPEKNWVLGIPNWNVSDGDMVYMFRFVYVRKESYKGLTVAGSDSFVSQKSTWDAK